jgi:uncharacterized membrane protein YhaH (DUF805 family)
MNKKLLDIRIGRTNRQQVLAFMGLTIALVLVSFLIPAALMGIFFMIGFPFMSYFTLVIMARRLRDIGHSGWYVLPLYSFMPVMMAMAVVFMYFITDQVTLFITVAGVINLLYGLGFMYVLLKPGTRGPNKYGPEPEGLNFKSMVTNS